MGWRDARGLVFFAAAAAAGAAALAAGAQESVQGEMVAVGLQKQLFLDDYVVAGTRGVRRVLHTPRKHPDNPVVRADRPWELFVRSAVSAVYDPEAKLFRMWYHAYGPPGGPAEGPHAAYARSRDGIHWEKPSLGLVALDGNTDNNLLNAAMRSVVINSDDPDPDHRFLGLAGGSAPMSAAGYYSPDGLHWTKFAESSGDLRSGAKRTPPNPDARFLFLTQTWAGSNAWGAMRRGVMRADSEDFADWGGYRVIFRAGPDDPPNLEFYSMEPADFRLAHDYHGLHLGFLWPFHTDLEGQHHPVNNVAMSGTIDVELVVSRDTVTWQRVAPGTPFLPLGAAGAFDSGMIFLGSMVEYGDDLYFYYDGWDRGHGEIPEARPAIGLAVLPRERFLSLEPDADQGTVTTKPFTLEGDALEVNADAAGGRIQVAVLDASGAPLPGLAARDCQPIAGDGFALPVAWKAGAGLAALRGKPVRLRFYLADGARLYAFQVVASEEHPHA